MAVGSNSFEALKLQRLEPFPPTHASCKHVPPTPRSLPASIRSTTASTDFLNSGHTHHTSQHKDRTRGRAAQIESDGARRPHRPPPNQPTIAAAAADSSRSEKRSRNHITPDDDVITPSCSWVSVAEASGRGPAAAAAAVVGAGRVGRAAAAAAAGVDHRRHLMGVLMRSRRWCPCCRRRRSGTACMGAGRR